MVADDMVADDMVADDMVADDMVADDAIVAEHLTKRYGTARGVEDLTFAVRTGEVFGFLGPNGAGKSTTIRTMLDLIRPTSGAITVFGMDPRADGPRLRAREGYMPGEFGLYERLTGERYLRDFAAFRGGRGWDRARQLTERLRLDADQRIASMSHGNKRKLGLIQAFMHEPELLVLDEPTQGLDPLVQHEFYAMIDEARARGATVFLSSHVMPEVERVCDRVAIIREGRLIALDDVGDLKARALRMISFHFERPVEARAFTHLPSVVSVESHGDVVTVTVRGPVREVIQEAGRHPIVNVTSQEPSLEEIFLQLYRDGKEAT